MNKVADITGQRFGRLEVLSRQTSDRKGQSAWLCQCDCGNKCIIQGVNLRSERTKSCGCLQKEITAQRNKIISTSHGMSNTKIYNTWAGMLKRCRNKKHPAYKYYGARGIAVCDRWLKIENFYKDMGDPPKGLTLERIDNDREYSPDNCKWATYKEQANNKSSNVIIKYKDQKFTISQWAKELGIDYATLRCRLRLYDWPIERALTEKVRTA